MANLLQNFIQNFPPPGKIGRIQCNGVVPPSLCSETDPDSDYDTRFADNDSARSFRAIGRF